VRDPTGTGVAAEGEILSDGNGFRRTFKVPSDGHYALQDLPFRVYRLSLEAKGFAPWSDIVEVHSEVPVNLGITLGVAPVTTQVNVNDELTLIDPTRTGTIYSIGQQTIHEELSPQPRRALLDLVDSQPGWLYEANGMSHPRGSEYDVQFVVDGQPQTQNRSPAFAPDMDSDDVESVRVLTASYPAEYGRKLGGVIEVTSNKTVAQGWHGDLEADGGSFDHLNGVAGFSYAATQDQFTVRAARLHSERYLDPPVVENYSNQGNSGLISAASTSSFSRARTTKNTIAKGGFARSLLLFNEVEIAGSYVGFDASWPETLAERSALSPHIPYPTRLPTCAAEARLPNTVTCWFRPSFPHLCHI